MKIKEIKLPSETTVKIFTKPNMQLASTFSANEEAFAKGVTLEQAVPLIKAIIWSWDMEVDGEAIELTEANIMLLEADDITTLSDEIVEMMNNYADTSKMSPSKKNGSTKQ